MSKREGSYPKRKSLMYRIAEAALPLACLAVLIPIAIVIAIINDILSMGRQK